MSTVAENRPRFEPAEAGRIAEDLYGVCGSVRELPSERDQNFLLTEESGRQFVLKVAGAAEREETLDLQNRAMEHLSARLAEYAFPRPLPALQGGRIAVVRGRSGSRHFVRLLAYVTGRLLADVQPHSPDLLRSLGKFYGAVDRSLVDFNHPAAERELIWDLRNAHRTTGLYLEHVRDAGRRDLLQRFIREFESLVVPRLRDLRTCAVHNDGNDYNILVGNGGEADTKPGDISVIGVLDFGDMLRSVLISDPAIAAAYAILGKKDPLGAASAVVAGYHSSFPLTETELEVLPVLIAGRLSASVAVSAFQQAQEPGNRYLSISEAQAWEALERLSSIHPRHATYTFREACGLAPCPRSAAVVRWLRENQAGFGPVVDAGLSPPGAVPLDLSPGSLALSDASVLTDVDRFTRWVDAQLAEAGARVGIGRYAETRLAYSEAQYLVERDWIRESRTLHIGTDLFAPVGTPVFAPVDGVIHSLANNDRRQDYGPTIILEHRPSGAAVTFHTLYGHLSLDSISGLQPGRPVARGERIGSIGDRSVNGGWPPHLHFQIIADMLGRVGDFPGVAPPGNRALWLSLCPDPNLILRVPEEALHTDRWECAAVIRARDTNLSRTLSVSYKRPLHIVRGFMQHLYDIDGQRYLDAVNNVPHVGHSHPRVVRAAQMQAAVLNTNTRYLHENLARYAQRLCRTLPEPLRVCFFVNSGSEANDLALRLARTHTKRTDMIVIDGAYHGNLTSLIEISPYKFDGPGGTGAPPRVHKVPTPDMYRGLYREDEPRAAEKYAGCVDAAIEHARGQSAGPAAFIGESVMSCAGQIVLPPGYLRSVYAKVRAAGGICIADEVQVGFGRVGSHFWAFETQGVVPDIVTMGKPIGNGHPLGAVVTTPEVAASFANGMEYFNTFGGNPVSCAVGLSVLDVIEEEELQSRAKIVGDRLQSGLRNLAGRHRIVGDVRGLGLFLGVELVRDRGSREPAGPEASYIAERMKDRGILVSTDGPAHNVLKIKPPLVFDESDADQFVDTLHLILGEEGAR
jgi:4-aminobutyrate aminotransferase-like enzyme/Ser/Thr protein kinase RdoA (MazF antagonist)